jgi:hypothetical protein
LIYLKFRGSFKKMSKHMLKGMRVDFDKTQGLICKEATPHAIWTAG